jgi:hypothetical protein
MHPWLNQEPATRNQEPKSGNHRRGKRARACSIAGHRARSSPAVAGRACKLEKNGQNEEWMARPYRWSSHRSSDNGLRPQTIDIGPGPGPGPNWSVTWAAAVVSGAYRTTYRYAHSTAYRNAYHTSARKG